MRRAKAIGLQCCAQPHGWALAVDHCWACEQMSALNRPMPICTVRLLVTMLRHRYSPHEELPLQIWMLQLAACLGSLRLWLCCRPALCSDCSIVLCVRLMTWLVSTVSQSSAAIDGLPNNLNERSSEAVRVCTLLFQLLASMINWVVQLLLLHAMPAMCKQCCGL